MAESVTLYHPTLEGESRLIEGKDLIKRHLAAGWQKSAPTGAKVQPAEDAE